jgi:Dolichyl-phosphate-mannose-protein mannosyltransferase
MRLKLTRLVRASSAPALVVALAAAWTLLRGIDHRYISFSDGAYMYTASVAAGHGLHELYRGIALSLPPGTPIGATLVWKLSPHIESIRLALALVGGVTALLTYRVARTLFGLGVAASVVAALLALTGPVHAQFVGLEGETFVTPLALGLAIALERRRDAACLALVGVGFLFKLTWAPFFVAAMVALALRSGWRRALTIGAGAVALSFALYAAAVWAFDWSPHQLVVQLLLAQSHSGFQLGVAAGILAAVLVIWWPLLLLAAPGWREASTSVRLVVGAAAACSLFMVKQGTFFNVLDPLEPFLAILAVTGAGLLWERNRPRMRALVVLCTIGAALHIASVTGGPVTRALPLPLGAAIVDTDNEAQVDRVAAAVAAHSRPDEPVLVNPLFALVAHRSEPAQAVDWFILRSLERLCGERTHLDSHCGDWNLAKAGRFAVVGVDSNVASFDSSFRRDTGVASLELILSIDEPPIKTSLYTRR